MDDLLEEVKKKQTNSERKPHGHRHGDHHHHDRYHNIHPKAQAHGHPRRRSLKQPLTKDMPRILAELLNEPKQALLHRVVRTIGPKQAWNLLKETLRLEQEGGQEVNAMGSGRPDLLLVEDTNTHERKPRRRTTGGVYFTLLKAQVPRETYRTIYEIEEKKKKELKKRARYKKKQRMEQTIAQLGFDELNLQIAANSTQETPSQCDDGKSEPMAVL